ncbi:MULTISPECIES: DUF1330 domain-containing protein [unclassified Pantoea]|uniref:DUF1330 domain-containing protein n=1 Tax=unclassified Pantoea TaxID=2630326 RepID=UPI001CD62188|nr:MULTISPECIES: DUF1330 domain-containing protein [unclassified Pantoea]MCA1179377.1 DUF1330 domain-containing protein [Pantoea sp. alder69]MCA1252580.1 DUF1330 domain-containing protein [Pantoea sp. alder70]MCA1268163.1 DUF1330 domain-containing protein [Pantoea sp. alder81]
MSAYWIAHVNIDDAQQYQNYIELAPLAFKKYQAKFIARGENATSLEGEAFKKHVIIEFPDYQTALDCYHSDEYQLAKKQRENVATAMITIVDGLV